MVFRQVGNDTDNLINKLGLLNKSFADIKRDFQNGQGLRSLGNFISNQDVENFKKFNSEFEKVGFHKAFNDNLATSHSYIQKQAVAIRRLNTEQYLLKRQFREGKITQEQYNTALQSNQAQITALTTKTQALTLAQKASAVASKAAVVALNMIGNIAIMAGINLIITGITKLVNRQKELAEQAKESAEKVNEQAKSLEELKKKYEEICNSTDDEKTKNEQLNEIKQELIEKYGFEEEAIDKINTKREKGLGLLEEEIRLNNKKSRGEWLGNNTEAIEKAENAIETSYVGKKDGIISVNDVFNGGKINLNNISKSILDMFESVKHYEYGVDDVAFLDQHTAFDVGGNDIIEKYENIQDIISALGNKTDRTDEEEQLLKLLNEESDAMEKILDKYQDTYETAKKLKAENLFDDYTDDNPIAEVNGKDAYLAWKDGLLKTAKGDKYIEQNLIDLIEEQFPDYTEYFEKLDKAKSKFITRGMNSKEGQDVSDFLESLTSDELEIATQIPDLFAEGLEGATKKIEEWNKNNPISPDVSIDETELSEVIETTSKKVKLITTAMEEQSDTGYISSSTYADIIEMGGNFADCLEVQNGKLKLNVQKLKDLEKQENLNAIAANRLAIAELQVSAARAGQIGDTDAVESIRKQISALDKENALYYQRIDEITNAKLNGTTDKEVPTEIQNFLDDYAKYHHDINMGIKKEDEDYYNWLDKTAHDAYSKYPDYEDELWKYEEEVYKGRKQLAEDYFDEEQKLFEDRVSNLETQIEITTKTSESSDGTKLNTKEKYDYIKDGYQEIINIIEERINEIVQIGVEGHEEILTELEKQLDEYKEKLADVFKSAVEEEKDYIEKQKKAYSDSFDERIDKMKEQQKVSEEAAQAEIDAIDEKIDALKKANEVEQEANDLIEARQNLEKATQKTRAVFGADGSKTYQVDQEKVKEAKEAYNKALLNQQVRLLEDQKEALESAKDKQSEAYDAIINNLETEKENGEKRFDILLQVLDEYLNPDNTTSNADVWSKLAKIEGAKYENGVWSDKDGNVIDINELMKSVETKTDDKKTETVTDTKTDTKDNSAVTGTMVRKSFSPDDNENEAKSKKDKAGTAIENFFRKLEDNLGLKSGSLNLDKAYQMYSNSPMMNFDPYGAMKDRSGLANKEYVSNVNNQRNITSTFTGDININSPVGDSNDLAKELMMNLPNAFQKQIYTNLK